MNEEILIQILKEVNKENIRFGTCDIKITFHDSKIQFFEVSSNRRINISSISNYSARRNSTVDYKR